MKRFSLWILVALALAHQADGRDRIVLQPPDKSTPLTISGDIADYNAEFIEIHLTVGKPVHEYSADQVVSVETVQTEAHRAGVRQFQDGQLAEAQVSLEQALSDEPRGWVQREILGWLVKIALRRNDRLTAGRRFLQLATDEDAPREYAVIPLIWGTVPTDSNLLQHGRLWLTGSFELERLIGASVLLLDPRFSATAKAELDRLARVADSRIAELARAQLWRLRVTAPNVTDNELSNWEETIQRMPVELRAGPWFLLGRAAMQRSEYDRAAAAFMWLPTVDHENDPLTAQAALGAATALKRIGRLEEARLLLTELISKDAWASAAPEARTLLTELEPVS